MFKKKNSKSFTLQLYGVAKRAAEIDLATLLFACPQIINSWGEACESVSTLPSTNECWFRTVASKYHCAPHFIDPDLWHVLGEKQASSQ